MMNKRYIVGIAAALIAIVVIVLHIPRSSVPQQPSKPSSPTVLLPVTGKTPLDPQGAKELQSAVDHGHQPWRLDSKSVAIVAVYPDGLASNDPALQEVQTVSMNRQLGVAVYRIPYHAMIYTVTVTQPVVGTNKIWVASDVELVQ